jgi:hypothetical protein
LSWIEALDLVPLSLEQTWTPNLGLEHESTSTMDHETSTDQQLCLPLDHQLDTAAAFPSSIL